MKIFLILKFIPTGHGPAPGAWRLGEGALAGRSAAFAPGLKLCELPPEAGEAPNQRLCISARAPNKVQVLDCT